MKIITGRTFRYDIQECIPRYYQVFGKCQKPGGPKSGGHCTKNGDCPTTTVVTVQACDVNEVCQELQNLGLFDFQIEKILRVNRPVLTRDDGGEDPTCTTDVTPDVPPPNCERYDQGVVRLLPEVKVKEEEEKEVELSYGDTRPQAVRPVYVVGKHQKERHHNLKGSGDTVLQFYGVAQLTVFSDTVFDADAEGELLAVAKGSSVLEGEAAVEAITPSIPVGTLPLLNEVVSIPCCQSPLPLTIEFKHSLNLIPELARFLNQNRVFLPGLLATPKTDFIKLNFNEREQAWVGTVHLIGDSPVVAGTERWDMTISFGCQNNGTWDFVLNILVRRPDQKFISTFSAAFPTATVCKSDSFVKLNFNLSNGETSPASAVVLNDEAGFFRNLRISFRLQPQDVQSLLQLDEDNTAAYLATFGES